MFKKTLLVGAVALVASSAALADGFYFGAGVGGTGFHDGISIGGGGGAVDQGNLGVIGGLLAGYNFNLANQFNLGLEAFGNATSAKISDSDGTTTFTIKSRYNFGARVLPGYQVTPDTDLHAIVGYVRGQFQENVTVLGVSGSQNLNVNGFQAGVGSGTNLAKNVALRGDIIYSGYQSITDNFGNQHKFNTLDGIVSVAYKFG